MCGVTPLDSHVSCPILSWPDHAICARVRVVFSLSEFSQPPWLAMAAQASAVKAGGPAQFLTKAARRRKLSTATPGTMPRPRLAGSQDRTSNAPQLPQRGYMSLLRLVSRFWRTLRSFRTEGRKSLDRCLIRRTVWLSSDPSGSCRREPETRQRRTTKG